MSKAYRGRKHASLYVAEGEDFQPSIEIRFAALLDRRQHTSMIFAGLALLMLASPSPSVSDAPCPKALSDADLARPMTEPERSAVIEALARMSAQLYVDPAKGKQLADTLRRKHAAGGLRLADPAAFAEALTTEMRSVVPDKHLKVRHQRIEPNLAIATADTAEAKAARFERFRRSAAYDGYGLRDVKVLPGNIGYLSLGEFWSPEVSAAALNGAMAILKDSDALIIDVRDSYGGHEDVALLIASYLLPAPEPIFTSTDRSTGAIRIGTSAPRAETERLRRDVPVYVLTSKRRTFSAAEMLALAMKRKRAATIVGEQTRGGANGGDFRPLSCRFDAFVPYFSSTVDGINWEGVGITPDVAVAEASALDEAYRLALAKLVEKPLPLNADSLTREIREERVEMLEKTKGSVPR